MFTGLFDGWINSAFTILGIVNFIIAISIIFLERKNPSATLAWLCILFLLPVVGIVLYIFLSQNIARQKIFKMTKDEERIIGKSLSLQIKDIGEGKYNFSTPEAKTWLDMIKLNQSYAHAYYTQDNKVTIMTDGNHMYNSLLDDIRKAKHSINVEFFIVKKDFAGKGLIDALTQKAKEGVTVRLLLDAVGSREIWEKDLDKFKKAGGKYAFFFKNRFRVINLKLNYRNHRKIVVVDGKIGYIGGFNIGKEYLGKKRKFGYWRDTHLRILGGAVNDLNTRFLMDWRFASGEEIELSEAFYNMPNRMGNTGIQIVCSGPDSSREEVKRAYMKMITSATKNVYLQTPYFVPDKSILESLKMAALSGVDVRVMIPCMPDHMFVYWATYSYAGEMLRAGVRVFIYENGFLHAKTMTADGEVATVGTTNFDIRSFRLNFECNAFIYDAEETFKLEAAFESDMSHCKELTVSEYKKRGNIVKFKESIARLLSDLL